VRETFAGFTVVPIDTTYSVGSKPKAAGEVLISNYPLPANDA
jgi:DNA adenine methylase